MSIKSLFKSGLRAFGFDVVRHPPLSNSIGRLLRDRDVNLVLDVGAYHGTFCKMIRQESRYSGNICSFEPTADSFKILSNTMSGDPAWRGFNFGLSDVDATSVLNTYGELGVFNSLLRLRDEDAAAYEVQNRSSETVALKKLDSIWNEVVERTPQPKIFMKIDTQGHEPEVLRGAIQHLDHVVAILSELPAIEIYENMMPMHASLKLFQDLHFLPIGFYPVNTPEVYGGATPEFDVLFLRDPKIGRGRQA